MELTEQSDVMEGKTALCYEVLQHLGDCYIAVDDYGQAGKCYEKAASLCPDQPQPYVGLGLTALVTTEKDAVKLAALPFDWPGRVVALRIDVDFLDDGDTILAAALDQIL